MSMGTTALATPSSLMGVTMPSVSGPRKASLFTSVLSSVPDTMLSPLGTSSMPLPAMADRPVARMTRLRIISSSQLSRIDCMGEVASMRNLGCGVHSRAQ